MLSDLLDVLSICFCVVVASYHLYCLARWIGRQIHHYRTELRFYRAMERSRRASSRYLRIGREQISLTIRANLAQATLRIADAQRELEGIERTGADRAGGRA